MTLPNLPKKHKKQEADFGLMFREWWNLSKLPGEFELKDTRGSKRFKLSELSPDQRAVMKAAIADKGILLRRTMGTRGAADYSGLINSMYWVVINFGKHFYVISAYNLLNITKPSITEVEAKELATFSI